MFFDFTSRSTNFLVFDNFGYPLFLFSAGFHVMAKKRGRPKKVEGESQNHRNQQDVDSRKKSVDSRKRSVDVSLETSSLVSEDKVKKGKLEKLKYKRIQIETLVHNLIVTIHFLIEKQRGKHLEISESCDGKTFRVLKSILIDNLANVFLLFWSLENRDLSNVRVLFSLSKNKIFSLNLLDLKKLMGKKSVENDLKLALLDWFKSNSFFTRGNNCLLGVEIILNDAAINHLRAQNIPENYTLRTVYILSKKDIIETN